MRHFIAFFLVLLLSVWTSLPLAASYMTQPDSAFVETAAEPARVDTTATDSAAVKTEIIALKNNLLYDAALTPNLQVEVVLSRRWTIELGAGFNPFPLDDAKIPKWRHLMVSIAPRYWFCNAFHRDFLSFNAAYAHFNVAGDAYPVAWMYPEVKNYRYQGDAVMAGVSYGWHWAISPHFSIELEAGVDAGYAWFDEYKCEQCGEKRRSSGRWLVLPKVGLSLVVPLGGDEESLERRCDCELQEDTVAPSPAVANDQPEEDRPVFIPASPLRAEYARPVPVRAFVPSFVPRVDEMQRLRSRLLRDAEEYEPYDTNMALSADPRNVFLFFDVNVTKMDRSFIQNDLKMDSIVQILGEAIEDTTLQITHIQIVGFASFDGRRSYNESLAQERAQTIKEYMQSLYALDDSLFAVCNGGESWAELQYRLEQVEFPGRDEVLAAIKYEPDLDKREALIKKLGGGETYRYMRDELKQILRNLGCITIYVKTEN